MMPFECISLDIDTQSSEVWVLDWSHHQQILSFSLRKVQIVYKDGRKFLIEEKETIFYPSSARKQDSIHSCRSKLVQ